MPSRASCAAGRMEMHQQGASINEVLRHRPSAESPMLQRELASIHKQVCHHCTHAITSQTYAITSHSFGCGRYICANSALNVLALHRCDLTLVCSPVELELLRDHYGVPAGKLALAPFFVPPTQAPDLPPFAERSHFVSIGNFKHPPNLDSVGCSAPYCPSRNHCFSFWWTCTFLHTKALEETLNLLYTEM